jgi:hypothetical protein
MVLSACRIVEHGPLALLVDEQFGVADNVDEENVPDLQFDLFFNFSGHSGRDLALRELH